MQVAIDLDGVLVDQTYGESDAPGDPPDGYRWPPIQRNDEAGVCRPGYFAARAFARAIDSPHPPVMGVPLDSGDDDEGFEAPAVDWFVATPIHPPGLRPLFTNVNEDGEAYGLHRTLEPALRSLWEFPNDSIVITYERTEEAPCQPS